MNMRINRHDNCKNHWQTENKYDNNFENSIGNYKTNCEWK